MAGHVRLLNDDDLSAARRVLSARPVENVFVAARVRAGGLERFRLGCSVLGYWRGSELIAMLHSGANLVPVNADEPEIVEAFVEWLGPARTCSSIIGPSAVALGMWQGLGRRWGHNWSTVREVRARQPMMSISTDPVIAPDPRVRRVTMKDYNAYFNAAVSMYVEEVGQSPIQGDSSSYRLYVRRLIESGRAFGIVERGRVIYKSDLGSVTPGVGQIQGVWLSPELRGQRLAPAAMAGVVRLAQEVAPTVSLYVNDFNQPARATYRRMGFREVGEFATVLY